MAVNVVKGLWQNNKKENIKKFALNGVCFYARSYFAVMTVLQINAIELKVAV